MARESKEIEPRLLALAGGLLAAVVLGVLSVRALMRGDHLQDELNRRQALRTAIVELAPLVLAGEGDRLTRKVRELVHASTLGITYLSVSDARGHTLVADGRYESIGIPGLSTLMRQQIRSWLYRFTSDQGTAPLTQDGRPVGRIDYALAPDFAADVRESAIGELRFAGWFGLLLALPTLGALGFAITRRPAPEPEGGDRGLEDDPSYDDGDESHDEGRDEADVTQAVRQHGIHALDALNRALIVIDRDSRIRFMNQCAAEITGWTPEDARGRLVYSVFHPLDDEQAPLVTPAETSLRENREYEPAELWVRSRDGTVRAVEVMAALLREKAGAAPTGAAMVFHVIDDRRHLVDQLRRQARLSQGVIDHLVEGVLTTDPSGIVRFANARALRMFGYTRDEVDGASVTKLMPIPFLNTPGLQLTDYIGGRPRSRLPRVVGWRKDATTFPIELVVQPMTVEDAEGLVVIVRDITERLRGENLAQRLGRLLDSSSEEIYIFDAQSLYFVEVNRGALRNLGYQAIEMTRLTPLTISTELESETFHSHLNRLRAGDVDHVVYRCKHMRADGSTYPVEVRLNFSREEEPPMYMAVAVDVTEREAQEDHLRRLAHHDALTGLPNRATLLDRLRQAILTASRSNRLVGVFFVDLDRFKQINDSFGHDIGDRVLEQAAARLADVLREADTVARIGGDEFVVVAQGLRGLDDAEGMARKILEVFEARLEIPDHDLRVTPSIGVSLYPLDESDEEGLLRHADAAMYQAKQAGPGQYRMYSVEMPPEKKRRLDLERSLPAAFALNQFEIEVRPAFDLGTGGVAALMIDFSWMHPRLGRVPASEVVAAAGRAGTQGDLELWLLYHACMLRLQPASDDEQPPLPVVVGLSGWQLRDPEFSGHVFELMERHEVPPRQLVFALSAEGLSDARDASSALVRRMLERGVRFALRGAAGAAFTALNRQSGFPLDLLVLQPDEVRLVPGDAAAAERLRLALLSAEGSRLPVLATGVASVEASAWLKGQGCRYVAGPLLSEPLAPAKVPGWLEGKKRSPI